LKTGWLLVEECVYHTASEPAKAYVYWKLAWRVVEGLEAFSSSKPKTCQKITSTKIHRHNDKYNNPVCDVANLISVIMQQEGLTAVVQTLGNTSYDLIASLLSLFLLAKLTLVVGCSFTICYMAIALQCAWTAGFLPVVRKQKQKYSLAPRTSHLPLVSFTQSAAGHHTTFSSVHPPFRRSHITGAFPLWFLFSP
jgi:hypothetical protein